MRLHRPLKQPKETKATVRLHGDSFKSVFLNNSVRETLAQNGDLIVGLAGYVNKRLKENDRAMD